jgi:hypothetical protein
MFIVGFYDDVCFQKKKIIFYFYFLNIFFGLLHLATFIFVNFMYVSVIASIAYTHPVYRAGVQTYNLLVMSRLP